MSNGNRIVKTLTLTNHCEFEVSIASHLVDLRSLGVDNRFNLNTLDVLTVFEIVTKLKICNGVNMSKSVVVSRFHTLEVFTAGEVTFKCTKSLNCQVVLAFNGILDTCRVC